MCKKKSFHSSYIVILTIFLFKNILTASLAEYESFAFKEFDLIESSLVKREDVQSLNDYTYNPYVPVNIWLQLKPYFLPFHHPVRKKLDQLFHRERATLSEETFEAAGFSITRRHRPLNAVVTGHPKLDGYLLKVYLDSQLSIIDWQMWLRRIQGAEVIRACLKKHGYNQFAVPQKWIYPLPAEPSPPLSNQYSRKNFILIVEDMHILNSKENKQAYKHKMTESLLEALYTVLTECQLTDCAYIGNMPFTKEGKIAFIDTELFFNGIPNFNSIKKRLSVPMQHYLEQLIHERHEQ